MEFLVARGNHSNASYLEASRAVRRPGKDFSEMVARIVRIIRGAGHRAQCRHTVLPFFFRMGAGGIRRTSNFGAAAAYVGAGNERDSEVSLVLVTFLSSGTACHVNLPVATLHHGVRLLRLRELRRRGRKRGCRAMKPRDGWMDGQSDKRSMRQRKI